jgi:hypothetical protein
MTAMEDTQPGRQAWCMLAANVVNNVVGGHGGGAAPLPPISGQCSG